jgi:small GTP-binding protein
MSKTRSNSNTLKQTKYNLAVVGGGAVGKSAFTIQFIQQTFCDEYDPTIEDQHRKQVVIDDECTLLDILDTAGQEEYSAMRDQYIRSAEGFLLVFSLTSRSSYEEAKQIYNQILRVNEEKEIQPPVVLLGNKCDLIHERQVTSNEIENFVTMSTIKYFEGSAKERINVDQSFFEVVRLIRTEKNGSKSPSNSSMKKKKVKCSIM